MGQCELSGLLLSVLYELKRANGIKLTDCALEETAAVQTNDHSFADGANDKCAGDILPVDCLSRLQTQCEQSTLLGERKADSVKQVALGNTHNPLGNHELTNKHAYGGEKGFELPLFDNKRRRGEREPVRRPRWCRWRSKRRCTSSTTCSSSHPR